MSSTVRGVSAEMKRTVGEGLGAEEMTIMPLGAGNEVGRSCIMLKFKGKTIMVHSIYFWPHLIYLFKLDCGVHPAYSGIGALPFFDEIDPESVDLVLITQYPSMLYHRHLF